MLRRCLEQGCPRLVARGRCPGHTRTTTQRGYGSMHQAARAGLGSTLPNPCGYCGVTVQAGERWDAAHVVDGDPSAGYVVAHPRCNQRAKAPRGVEGGGVAARTEGGRPLTSAPALFHSEQICQTHDARPTARTGGR